MRKLGIALSVEKRGICTSVDPCGAVSPSSDGDSPRCTFHREEHDALLNRCFKRICGWRVPPNWSPADWCEEIKAHGRCAGCEAIRDFEASRGVPLDAFFYQRVIARAYSRFRREWAYGLRCISETDGFVPDGRDTFFPNKYCVHNRETSVEPDPTYQEIRDAVELLSEPDRQLITQLFWEEHTETNIAEALGISHQAVNKRKRAVIQKLRALIDATTKTETNVRGKVAKSNVRCISPHAPVSHHAAG